MDLVVLVFHQPAMTTLPMGAIDKNIILVMYCHDVSLQCNRGQGTLLTDKI